MQLFQDSYNEKHKKRKTFLRILQRIYALQGSYK